MNLSRSRRLTSIFIVLSLFQISVLAAPHFINIKDFQLIPRQQTTTTCADYSMIANYSTIGLNSTYRAAFLKASPQGTDSTTAILDGAAKKLKNLTMDKALNDKCGNLTTLALLDAAKNFTMGIVGPFTIKTANAGLKLGGGDGSRTAVFIVMLVGATLYL